MFCGDGEAGSIVSVSIIGSSMSGEASLVFEIKRGDTAPAITDTLKDSEGNVVDLTSAASLKFIMSDADGNEKVNASASFVSRSDGTVLYNWSAGDTDTVGGYRAEWQVTWSDGTVQTFPAGSYRRVKVYQDLGD